MIFEIFRGGIQAVKDYVAYHVLTCLLPAFLLAGGMVSFVSKEAIIRYLGAAAHRLTSYQLAALSSFFIAVCSCTVIPASSELYYQGAGVGAAFIMLWVAPAANILTILYTRAILGYDLALIRISAALLMALVVGWFSSNSFFPEI